MGEGRGWEGNRKFVEVSRASFVLVFSSPASQSILRALVEVRSLLICGWVDGRWLGYFHPMPRPGSTTHYQVSSDAKSMEEVPTRAALGGWIWMGATGDWPNWVLYLVM